VGGIDVDMVKGSNGQCWCKDSNHHRERCCRCLLKYNIGRVVVFDINMVFFFFLRAVMNDAGIRSSDE
jgi:hypothetical protein